MNNNLIEAERNILNSKWRINNLYTIVDKRGRKIRFELNWAQEELYDNMWYCNVVLKARQLGISTFICLLFLDRCLFNSNQSAGIIAHTLEDAQHLFRRVKFAYDNLPPQLIDKIKADNDTAQMLKFSNGSSLRVGTSLRSSTFQYLHVSEFGKICAKYPDKAQEIVTGSFNTVAPGQYIFIESTAEGKDGYFYDICKRAQETKENDLSKIDFKFHFFPWHKEPGYRIGSNIRIDDDLAKYFAHLKSIKIDLDDEQKAWYASRYAIQNEDMWREYPSTPEESWQVSNEGFYYGKQLTLARVEGRIGRVPYDDKLLVSTAWDLGGATATSDYTSIWFFQVYGKEIRIIDYLEGHNSLQEWIGLVLKKDYTYDMHLAPHDISVTEMSNGISRINTARKMGIRMLPVKKSFIIEGIDEVRNILSRCWFDEKKCEKGINALENYKKQWDDRLGTWENRPHHNWASHGCFTGDTLLLTRSGHLPIMLIEKDMEILTLNGWKKCNKATVTKKNAQLVEVRLSDGMNVRCTPDHLFLTEKGWISAKSLEKDIKIQSSLTQSQHISLAHCTGYGLKIDILRKADHICIEMFGKTHLGRFLENVISITKIIISRITNYQIWNVCPIQFISNSNDQMLNQSLIKPEKRQVNGINLMKGESGIEDRQLDVNHGLNGKEKKKNALYAKNFIKHLLEKTVMLKNTVRKNANPLLVLDVIKLNEIEDVYCINVPEIHHFSLSNGAIVHNSDAMRTLATGLHYVVNKNQSTSHNPSQYMQNRFAC